MIKVYFVAPYLNNVRNQNFDQYSTFHALFAYIVLTYFVCLDVYSCNLARQMS